MKKIVLVLASLSFSVQSFANPCAAKTVQVGKDKLELVQVKPKPEMTVTGQPIRGSSDVLVSGIYMFVRNGQTWNTYRCADENTKNPVLNLDKCTLKNDFEFGSLVKRYGNSGITVRKTDAKTLQVRLNVAGGEDLDYFDVQATEKGLEVIENKFKPNKQQPSQSRHEIASLGVCDTSAGFSQPTSKKSGTPAKKVGITN